MLSINRIIEIRNPGFCADPRRNDFIALATELTGTVYGDLRNQAIALRVLHWFTLDARGAGSSSSGGAGAGAITSESEGELSRDFGGTATYINERYPDLSSTSYGLELIQLNRGTIIGPRNRTI
jgi:hypothetical protein